MALPPSRRDNAGPPPANVSDLSSVVRHHRTALRSMDPGYIDGRFATPQPVEPGPSLLVGGDDGSGEDSPDRAWEDGDRHQIRATGTQSKLLSHVPIDESLFVRWHPADRGGLPLPNELWTLVDQTVTIRDPGCFAVRDTFSFQYEYEVEEGITEPEFISYSAVSGGNTSIPLPDGAEAGDLLVLVMMARTTSAVSDSRFDSGYHSGTHAGIWVGYEDGSGSAIAITLDSTGGDVSDAVAICACFRGDPMDLTSDQTSNGTTTPVVPTMPSGSGFGVTAIFGGAGLSSGSVQADTTGVWTTIHQEGSHGAGKCSAIISYRSDGTPAGSWGFTGDVSEWGARVVGVQS